MYFEDSSYSDLVLKKISLPYGNFYFLENVVVTEIAQGVTFTLEKARPVIDAALEFYGPDKKLGYVSNRKNNYAVAPQDWLRFFKEREILGAIGLVAYTPIGFTNIILEKLFIRTKIQRFTNLDMAISWTSQQMRAARLISW